MPPAPTSSAVTGATASLRERMVPPSAVGGETGNTNRVTDNYGMVGGGADNQAGNNNGTTDDAEYATVGGGRGNSAGGEDATIGGGAYISVTGQAAAVAGGSWITVTADYAAVGGGYQNVVAGTYAAVSGGLSNTASSDAATVGGGWGNTARAWYATVGGGAGNTASSAVATVGGGWLNTASAWYTTVGGGTGNTAGNDYATVGGGYFNRAAAITATIGGGSYISVTGQAATVAGGSRITVTGNYAAVGGGMANTAGGSYATIPGGAGNSANGIGSFAAGENATAGHNGSFVWSSAEGTSSWGNNTFTVRAHGGVRFYSASGTGTGVQLYHGGTSWGSISDRRVKENFADVDSARLLETLEAMPIQTWNLKAQSPAMRHIGPVAQDFNGMFSYLFEEVESPTHINNMDAIGVSLAAAQGLYKLSRVQATRIQTLEAENMAQQKQIDDLKARLAALEQTVKNTPAQHTNLPVPGWLFAGLLLTGLVQGQRARRGP